MSFGNRQVGKDNSSVAGVDPIHFATRVQQRPAHLGASGGAYVLAVQSGIMAAGIGAAAEIFQARWMHATMKMVLRSMEISAWRAAATAFTAGPFNFTLTNARAWTVDGGAGVPVVMSTNHTCKKRTSFPYSKFSDTGVRVSATAACTAGTKVLETNSIGIVGGFIGAVLASATVDVPPQLVPAGTMLWSRDTGDEFPEYYDTNEGPVVRVTIPATGTWAFAVMMEWAEVLPSEVEGWA